MDFPEKEEERGSCEKTCPPNRASSPLNRALATSNRALAPSSRAQPQRQPSSLLGQHRQAPLIRALLEPATPPACSSSARACFSVRCSSLLRRRPTPSQVTTPDLGRHTPQRWRSLIEWVLLRPRPTGPSLLHKDVAPPDLRRCTRTSPRQTSAAPTLDRVCQQMDGEGRPWK